MPEHLAGPAAVNGARAVRYAGGAGTDAPRCAVLGDGLLATAVANALGGDGRSRVETGPPVAATTNGPAPAAADGLASAAADGRAPAAADGRAAARVVVLASDGWDLAGRHAARELGARRRVPWLPVRTELGRLVIGPAELPGVPGCVDCAQARRRRARDDASGHDAVVRRHGDTLAARPSSWLTCLAADLAGELVAEEVRRLATDPDTARTRIALLRIDLETLQVTTHPVLADPLCPHCGALPDDAPDLAEITPRPRPKLAPEIYRVRDIDSELEALEATFVDAETGLVRTPSKGSSGGLAFVVAPVGLRDGGVEAGFGRTRSYRTGRMIALLEALERYGGVRPGGKRTTVHAAYADVRDHAVDPRTLGLHPRDSYRRAGFPYAAFDETRPCRWVWGHSFARGRPILVPEHHAYYRAGHLDPENPPFVSEISNGCALGGCLEEAILYGILEVAERDAFLMTWYARLQVPRIDLESAADRTIPLIAEAIRARAGHEIMVFDTTMEHGIPCVWAMAVNTAGGSDCSERTKVMCAAGSHINPEKAVENALCELGPVLGDYAERYPREREKASRLVEDSALVTTMEDHSLLYAHPAAFPRLDFLTGGTPARAIADVGDRTGFANPDLRDDLYELSRRYLDTGLDIIVVDQTTPEHRAGGLSCVKVIIPGTLPMTFGHHFRRVDGIPRLHNVPRLLGYRDTPLAAADINPYPHPFP